MAYSESDVVTKLKTRRDAVLDELAAMSTSTAGGKPDSEQGGIRHMDYKRSLYEELDRLNKEIGKYADPFEVVVEACT